MKAIGVYEFGGPDALQVLDLPDPEPGPGEVRIRVQAAAVNPTDTGLRAGTRAAQLNQVSPPHVPGMDAAGVLDAIGPDTSTDLEVGAPVMAIVVPWGAHGAYAEYITVPADSVVAAPKGASIVEAATLPMNALTARLALDTLALQPGQWLAVTGAAGALGGYLVQLAKADGLRVVADAAPADEKLVRELGADVVLPRGDDYPERVRGELPDGADGAVDAALLNEKVLPAVRDGGVVVTVRGYAGPEPAERGVTFQPVRVANYATNRAALDKIRQQAEAGQVTLRVADVLPAEQAPEAHRRLEAGGVRGRLVLQF